MRVAVTFLTLAMLAGGSWAEEGENDMQAPMIHIPYANIYENILSGGQPSDAQLQQARAAGYRMVINLRADAELEDGDQSEWAQELGLEYHRIPVAGAAGVTEENARTLNRLLEQAGDEPVLVHCASGNRVGALIALGEWLDGAGPEQAVEIGKAAGMTGLEPLLREKTGCC